MNQRSSRKPAFKFQENIVRLVQKDQQRFAQDYLYMLHLAKIYGSAEFDELREFAEQYKTKIQREFIEREIERTRPEDVPSAPSDMAVAPADEGPAAVVPEAAGAQGRVRNETTQTDEPAEPQAADPPSTTEPEPREEPVFMPFRNRNSVNVAQPLMGGPVHAGIGKSKHKDGFVGVVRGDHQVHIRSAILCGRK